MVVNVFINHELQINKKSHQKGITNKTSKDIIKLVDIFETLSALENLF